MRYSEEIIAEVLARNDIVDVVSSYIRIQRAGADYKGLCPFHSEKTPSFSVSPSKQIFHCFGCGKGGNAISFVMQYDNCSFLEALNTLAQRAGIALDTGTMQEDERKSRDDKNLLININREAAMFFYNNLKSQRGRIAFDYFRSRGISSALITRFGLGFADKSGNSLYRHLKKLGYNDIQLKHSGLVNFDERGARDRFWNRVIFPILNTNKKVIGFGGRVMGETLPKYINSPETKVFDKSRNLYGLNLAMLARKDTMLVCEGYMDVIALHQAGFSNAVASLGTALTKNHALVLKRYAKKIILTYDSDEAGTKAALRAIPLLKEEGLNVRVLDMKPYKDPDEFIKAAGAAEFEKRIEAAQNSFLWEINLSKKNFDMNDPESQTGFYKEIALRLAAFEEGLERDNYLRAVCREQLISYEAMKRLVMEIENRKGMGIAQRASEKRKPASENYSAKGVEGSPLLSNQKLLLSCMADNTFNMFEKISKYIKPEDFTTGFYRELAGYIYEMHSLAEMNFASIIEKYADDEDKQRQAAEILINTFSREAKEEALKKAASESILKLKLAELEAAGKKTSDIKELQRIMIERNRLKTRGIEL